MEIWGNSPASYSIDILSPSGELIPSTEYGLFFNKEVSFIFEKTNIHIDYQALEAKTGEQLILLRFHNPSPGMWRFNVYVRGDLQGSFHIWLPSDEFLSPDTYFLEPNAYTTITSPGDSVIPITVTAYNDENDIFYQNAGRGFNNSNIIKPDLAAPGVNILSPNLNHGFDSITGTSAAAAHTAGITALILEWGIVKGNFQNINTVEIKKLLILGADRNAVLTYPNRVWGYGILNLYNSFNILRTDF
jgi:subtilisin family serine protease